MKYMTDDLMTLFSEKRSPSSGTGTGPVITIGNFDGLHRGHMALLKRADQLADRIGQKGLRPDRLLLTFAPHPDRYFGNTDFRLIYTPEEKRALAEAKGLTDTMIVADFHSLNGMEPEIFVRKILKERYGAAGIVVGYDFRFGRQGRGDAALLKKLLEESGIPCEVVPEVTRNGETVSSTHIKQLLTEGRMAEAAEWLDHPFFVTGTVVSGKQVGRRLETPTLNIPWPEEKVKPAEGVYVSRIRTPGGVFEGITNLGTNPTFGGEEYRSETFLFDFHGNLYGETVSVELLSEIRPEIRFDSPEALKRQLKEDIQKAKAWFEFCK